MDTAAKTAPDVLKTGFKKVVHKAAKAIGEFIGNKIADKIVEPKPFSDDQYSANKNLRFKTPMLGSDLCDCSDLYIVVKDTVSF